MKVSYLLKCVSVVLLIISLVSCQDHLVDPQKPRFRITQTFGQSQYVYAGYRVYQSWAIYTYTYDRDGRLAEVVYHYDPANLISGKYGQSTTLQYDAQGQLSGSEKKDDYGIIERQAFAYDAMGNLSGVKWFTPSKPGSDTLILSAVRNVSSSPNQLTVVSTYPLGINSTYTDVFSFSNGNVVTVVNANAKPGEPPTVSTAPPLTYDQAPNPLYGQIFLGFEATYLSRNNIVYPNVQYTYNADGLLIKTYGGNASDFTETTYTYELY